MNSHTRTHKSRLNFNFETIWNINTSIRGDHHSPQHATTMQYLVVPSNHVFNMKFITIINILCVVIVRSMDQMCFSIERKKNKNNFFSGQHWVEERLHLQISQFDALIYPLHMTIKQSHQNREHKIITPLFKDLLFVHIVSSSFKKHLIATL